MRIPTIITSVFLLFLLSCSAQKQEADLILTNGLIYTVDEEFSTAEAVAIKDQRILAVAEQFCSRTVREGAAQIVIHTDDAVAGGLQQQLVARVQALQILLGAAPFAGRQFLRACLACQVNHSGAALSCWDR